VTVCRDGAAAAAFSASSPPPQAARDKPSAIMAAPARLFRIIFATSDIPFDVAKGSRAPVVDRPSGRLVISR
jgi:hypothetical protein